MSTTPDEQAIQRICSELRSRGQFTAHVDGADTDEIKRTRSLGRAAGRRLGWKVRTYATDPAKRDDGKSVVVVVLVESNPLHEELLRVRGQKAVAQAMDEIFRRETDGPTR